jgi:hypothetical protein
MLSIPKVNEELDEVSDLENTMSRSIKLNKISNTELILYIDVKTSSDTEPILCINVKTSSDKIAFNIVKECKIKDYPDGDTTSAWENFKQQGKCLRQLTV